MKWTESMIRREMEKLDKKTGLSGSKLPIHFTNGITCLGAFHYDSDSKMWFSFSKKYYQSDNFSKEEALDTIKHEYSHYMNKVLYNGSGHDGTWRKCCTDIGAVASRLYSGLFNDYYLEREKKDKTLLEELKQYRVGSAVRHPIFGTGYIASVHGNGKDTYYDVDFYSVGKKILTGKWIIENC